MINIQNPQTSEDYFEQLKFFPHQLLLETTSHCNLNCLMCARQFKPRKWGTMPLTLAYKILDEVIEKAPWCRVWFCYFGEPLVRKNVDLFTRIKYAKDKGLKKAVINSNGNLIDEQAVDNMLESGLDEIYIGLDAADPVTYAKIRRGGKYEKVMNNIHMLLEKSQGRISVTVQYGIYDENEHQVEEFKNYWSQYPVKIFIRPKLTWCGYLDDKIKSEAPRHACSWIFDSINVNDNGLVPYCVTDWDNRLPRGNANEESLFDIWQKKIFPWLILHARGDWEKLPEFCRKCPDWQAKVPRDSQVLKMIAQCEHPVYDK